MNTPRYLVGSKVSFADYINAIKCDTTAYGSDVGMVVQIAPYDEMLCQSGWLYSIKADDGTFLQLDEAYLSPTK